MAILPTSSSDPMSSLGRALHASLDANKDGKLDVNEFESFISKLSDFLSGSSSTGTTASSYLAATTPIQPTTSTTDMAASLEGQRFGDWRDFVWGKNTSGRYDYMSVAPPDVTVSSNGYAAGPYRHQLEGFNFDKMDPNHRDGMNLKYVAARVFEQIDVYSPSAIDRAVELFNQLGIPATKEGIDCINFGNGDPAVDVIRNSAYLDGDVEAGMGWQWLA